MCRSPDYDTILTRETFCTLTDATILIERWRWDYKTVRPRRALGYRLPAHALDCLRPPRGPGLQVPVRADCILRVSKGNLVRAIVRYVPLFALLGLLSACASESMPEAGSAGAGTDVPETEDQMILNALGQALAQSIGNSGLSAEEFAFVQRGLGDAVLGRDALVDLPEYGPKIRGFMAARAADAAEGELATATAFVEEQASLEGAERTESGIVIQEITAGTGARPTAEDTVQVHYHGTLRDGTVFDSSVDRGEPTTFPLTGVIPCWTEGLQQIGVGGKSRLVCPPDLAYGPQAQPAIPGNSALVFEIELLDIVQE